MENQYLSVAQLVGGVDPKTIGRAEKGNKLSKDSKKEIQQSMSDSLKSLMDKFKAKVASGDIEIRDIRDFKMISDIYQQLSAEDTTSEVPQMPQAVIRTFAKSFDAPDNPVSVNSKASSTLQNLDTDKVTDIIKTQTEVLNDMNAKDE